MNDHDINTISYGSRIDTDIVTMSEGMIELFDDLCDFALSRVFNKISTVNNQFNLTIISKQQIARFRFTWVVCLSELMFYGLREQSKLNRLKDEFYKNINDDARKRSHEEFITNILSKIQTVIYEDQDFINNGVINFPTSNRADNDSRNQGVGPKLAELIFDHSFGTNQKLEVYEVEIQKLIEIEFNNAYGHSSIACSKFNLV